MKAKHRCFFIDEFEGNSINYILLFNFILIMITIILMEPEHPGNIGAIARVMKNFGFEKLVLVNPKCKITEEARNRAKNAQDVLKKAKIVKKIPKFDLLVGTTAALGTDYNIARTPMLPEIFAKKIDNRNIGLLFGREGEGLHNREIEICDLVVTIPSSKKYRALNISHAVGILLYEIYKVHGKDKITDNFPPATEKEMQQINKMMNQVIDKLEFSTKEKKKTQQLLWKKLFGKMFLTKREAYAVMGLLRKLTK